MLPGDFFFFFFFCINVLLKLHRDLPVCPKKNMVLVNIYYVYREKLLVDLVMLYRFIIQYNEVNEMVMSVICQ